VKIIAVHAVALTISYKNQ